MLSVTGIILAGGYSRRMGSDKALLELGGQSVIARIATELTKITDRVLIACGQQERKEYSYLQYPLIVDRYPGCGPLAGLHAGISCSATEWSLVVACDLPFASAEFMRRMMGALNQHEQRLAGESRSQVSVLGAKQIETVKEVHAIVAVTALGRVQPLFGLYHKDVLPSLEAALVGQELRVMEWLEKLNVLYSSEAEVPGSEGTTCSLLNMNTPEDYHTSVRRMANHGV